MATASYPERYLQVVVEREELTRQMRLEGGFLTSDPRYLRLRALDEEFDEFEEAFYEDELRKLDAKDAS